ncbi:MAG: HD domain-containing protein [Bdellovibrionales bacterium]|nr:HD domain-containing protein [Bdellovibrionales bacterium]
MSSSWGDVPSWAYDAAQALMQSLKVVDPGTYAHCLRVGEMARKLARDAGLNEYEQKMAEFAGIFHDIGKIGVDPEIIGKPGKLDPRELDIMKNHPCMSEQIVRPLATHSFFRELLAPIRGHHERMDGEGYPDKLIGEKINVLSRVILVVDTYDAMSQTRAYRKGLPDDIVYAELKRCSGTQFDPQLVRIFLQAHPTWNALETDKETFHHLIKKIA